MQIKLIQDKNETTKSPHLQSLRKKINLRILSIKRFLEYFISGKDLQDCDMQFIIKTVGCLNTKISYYTFTYKFAFLFFFF